MSDCIAIIGAGRMGSVVAAQLPESTRKIIIDQNIAQAAKLVEKVAGVPSDDLNAAAQADMVAVVLPTPAVNEAVGRLAAIVKNGTIVLNMATTARIDPAVMDLNPSIHIIDAKIIGHAMSISRGEPGIIVVDCDDADLLQKIRYQLSGFHQVVQGNASLVETINKTGSTEGLRAAVRVRQELSGLKIPDEWIEVAIRTVCAGTMKSFTENDLGHFALELVRKLEKESQQTK